MPLTIAVLLTLAILGSYWWLMLNLLRSKITNSFSHMLLLIDLSSILPLCHLPFTVRCRSMSTFPGPTQAYPPRSLTLRFGASHYWSNHDQSREDTRNSLPWRGSICIYSMSVSGSSLVISVSPFLATMSPSTRDLLCWVLIVLPSYYPTPSFVSPRKKIGSWLQTA